MTENDSEQEESDSVRKLLYFTACIALVMQLACPALAAEVRGEQEAAAAYLREAGIMVGDENGDMLLEQGLTRAQMAALLTRIVANPEYIEADSTFYRGQCRFPDVPEWARVYVGYCAANYLVLGYDNGLYGSNDPVTPAAACTVMLRCLEDVDVEWDYQSACRTAVQLGLASEEMVAAAEITRGDMAVLICRTMARMGFKVEPPAETKTDETGASAISHNADGSINAPSDGSRYVPQVGDVLRCDDGTNYAITDVSRYDKNMFASGPLGELPEATCDWSLLPQPELPDAEVRHFELASGDYLFVRNLYETRRMLYTLYNAIGENAETWQDGAPVLHPSGNQKVHISLTIPEEVEGQSFWPWRESEITAPFHSNPCGTHCLEAWDVYKDGVFQRTEYIVYHTT